VKRLFFLTSICLILTPAVFSQVPTNAKAVQAELLHSVQAKKAKPGDEVTVRTITPLTLSDGTVLAAGAILIGQVQLAEADSGDLHVSQISISFDHVKSDKGQELPVKFSLRAAMMPRPEVKDQGKPYMPPEGVTPGSIHLNAGVVSLGDTRAATPEDQESTTKKGQATYVLAGSVSGMPGVQLLVDSGPGHGSTFKSDHKNLQLEKGLQLMLTLQ
jgi:hypothetical protein